MPLRIAPTHLVFLILGSITAIYLNWSAISASTKLYNLIVVVPVGIALLVLAALILGKSLLRPHDPEGLERTPLRETLGDVVLLACFGVFCVALTKVGFDLATFFFVWIGVHLSGEKRFWAPPLYAAVFTALLVESFGSLFPFPMPLAVLS
ncbi:tripartite tricarboxylate transporter TctB family protein [Afifella sp. YEN Y35]|uniref:tripartite tricarboxylate transporter TctB family protein n=1 Tax=Afifella sp. YEN Y35 TaxID=3388337 RepID=UPI0039E01E33